MSYNSSAFCPVFLADTDSPWHIRQDIILPKTSSFSTHHPNVRFKYLI